MKILLPVLVLFFAIFIGCIASKVDEEQTASRTPSPTPGFASLTLKQVSNAFTNAGLPLHETVIYDEKTDPNNLLGRPNGYIEKANFNVANENKEALDSTIEIFKNLEDAERRYKYVEAVGKTASPLNSYIYLHKNVVVRIELKALPDDAAKYQTALNSL